ncbi:MAG: DUF1952 domain-containing protein [Chloroflexi bacterium]|nr:DUF1952 domain-containing protein [Chloroflexota bacterium]
MSANPGEAPAAEVWSATLTGIPLWLLRQYIEQLGGQAAGEGRLRGEGWRAALEQVEDYALGSLRVGRVRLELAGEPEAVARLRRALEPKLLRAGG